MASGNPTKPSTGGGSQASDPLGSPISFRHRRSSVASVDSTFKKEQLTYDLDKIHDAARNRADSLTTFNDFAPPSVPTATAENKGSASDIVQQGFSGLYSRFRVAVGAGGSSAKKSQDGDEMEAEASARVSKHSASSSMHRTTSAASAATALYTQPVAAPDMPSSIVLAPSDTRSQHSQSSKPTSINLMPAAKSQPSVRQSLPTNATSAVVADPPVLSMDESGRSRLGNSSNRDGAAEGSAQRSLSRVDRDARRDSAEVPNLYDLTEGKLPPRSSNRDDASSVASVDTSRSQSQAERPSAAKAQTPHLRTPSSGSLMLSPDDIRRRPPAIERVSGTNSPHSRDSSTDRGTPAAPSPISISAHNSVYHGSISKDEAHRNDQAGRIPGTTLSFEVATDHLSRLDRMRRQVLSKDFWMKDDSVKECHLCQTAFSPFRRKHHCRTCGCIFDHQCTTIISGERFGVQGSLRVCKRCLIVISRRLDGSGSDDSGDDHQAFLPRFMGSGLGSGHSKSPSAGSRSKGVDKGSPITGSSGPEDARPVSTPMMAIPATRRVRGPNRASAVLEIDASQLSRPGSSRSLKSLASARPQSFAGPGHKRHHSKHGLLNRFKTAPPDRAPFRKGIDDEPKRSKFPAFHDDNIIDPELADYMSDESTEDEQMGLFSTMSSAEIPSGSYENDKPTLSASLNSNRHRRHKQGEKSISGLNSRGAFDDMSGPPSLAGHRLSVRRRNLSMSGSIHHLPPPRPKSGVFRRHSPSSEMIAAMEHATQSWLPPTNADFHEIKRKPQVELNSSSTRHVYRILQQLLEDSGIPSPSPWQKALVPILLRATDDVSPDVSSGEDMDIRHYVKLKRIPGGRPCDTSYVSGVVFTKNLALKSMPRKITNPRIVLVTFPVEYQRHEQQLMSLQPVIEQEKDYLRIVVQRITNLKPHVLLAEKGVSGVALQYLSEANIAVAYNVKHTVIEAVSRCAETEIITSVDMLALPVKVGRCSSFDVRTYVNNAYAGRKKSYIFLSGCTPELGCTISLRGASHAVLGKVKHIVDFMVYVVYNLKLESSLLRDESINPPENGEGSLASSMLAINESRPIGNASSAERSGPTVGLGEPSVDGKTTSAPASTGETSGMAVTDAVSTSQESDQAKQEGPEAQQPEEVPDDVPMPTFYSDMVAKYETKILSASPYVKFSQPYLLMRAREQERRLLYLRRLLDHDVSEQRRRAAEEALEGKSQEEQQRQQSSEAGALQPSEEQSEEGQSQPAGTDGADAESVEARGKESETRSKEASDMASVSQPFQLITPEMVERIGHKAPKQMMEILHAVHDAEYDKALFNYRTQTRHWETYMQGNLDLFDPYSHQNIVVLYSAICTETKIPCTEPELLALNFYDEQRYDAQMDPDCSLGQYIEDLVYGQDEVCTSNGCERKMIEHHRTYVHDQYRITVFVEHFPNAPPRSPELGDGITMWTYCKTCEKDSEETCMSTATFKYSFGKYLELLYWGRGLHMADSVQCGQDHHQDYVRYFSLADSRVRIHRDPIDLLEIVVPRARITWNVANDLKLKNEIYTKMEERWNRYMTSVKARLQGIRIDSVLPKKAEACKEALEQLSKKAQEDQPAMIRQLQDVYVNSKYYEVVPFNKITRQMLEVAGEWDVAFAKFEADFLGDKDMRQLTIMQLKKMFADDESKESLVTNEGTGSTADSDEPISQTFSEADEKSTQPTDVTESAGGLEGSSTTASSEPGAREPPSGDDGKSGMAAEGAVERVEALDLAGSPVGAKGAAGAAAAQGVAGDGISKAPIPVTPRAPESPEEDDGMYTELPPPRPSLGERIDQKRREQVEQGQGQGQPIDAPPPTPVSRATPERLSARTFGSTTSPPLLRANTQPVRTLLRSQSSSGRVAALHEGRPTHPEHQADQPPPPNEGSVKVDKKLSERLGLSALKSRQKAGQSNIPRLIHKKRDSQVSTLAKHFEQLSREFEKERMRDRKERAASLRHPRAMLPRTSTKAIVEVYDDVNEAVAEPGPAVEDAQPPDSKATSVPEHEQPLPPVPDADASQETPAGEEEPRDGAADEGKSDQKDEQEKNDAAEDHPSQAGTDDEGAASDGEQGVSEEFMPDIKELANSLEPSAEIPLELPKHQKTSLMRYLTNFWAERSASGWPALDYPVTGNDHIFVDSDIIIREDEPSSVIALALNNEDYNSKLERIRADAQALAQQDQESSDGSVNLGPGRSPVEGPMEEAELEKSLLRSTGTHLKYQFKDGASVMTCKIFYAEQFDALRRKCGVAERIVESLSRCLKWDSKGGKTKSVFLKTLDDRLVLKSLSPIETSAFLRFAPGYFSIMAESLFHDLPSVIAKMVGFFQVVIKNPLTGVDVKLDLLATENLFYDRSPQRIFDLKGSMRNRKIQSTGEQNEVLLDENMVEYIYESPLFAREHSKKLLRASVWNDTLFLAKQNVMDYSLMIAVDEDRKELVVGIIDCIRTYTWDKKLETWIKDRGRNRPTVTSPKEYKNRFREAMASLEEG
ncbi:1-phosphatidylinositol-3-phosphate 5-kinase [Geosmithia morbida]|uniref:1-phosphatidylinositol-3-phosphate 5-kinase n=1 Tax=Geosmithia morbida TaxID=1094350 RepID=A0A9P4YYQ2_9HYPO|nr:1-phosphatidylinositol-3-phosphate 5-kinase [Geosmithia morbida]KAF4124962.1 1-phosphatidylinositol-3-phosphate 5-kinase [Geosmithia morbida]